MSTPKILLVDDEQKVLASLTRELMEQEFCEILKADSATQAQEILKKAPDIYVVCSDFRMPGMNGINFLAEVQKTNPDVSRILLTGEASLYTAVEAVNRGKIFRFLLKPCPSEVFIDAIKAGIRQYQLNTAERDLLSKTLNASVKIMMEILSALNPDLFSQAARVRTLARALAISLHLDTVWEVELAAMLSQIGVVTIPPEILERWKKGEALSPEEQKMIASIPQMGFQLVQKIPRLENIALAIEHQDLPFRAQQGSITGDLIPVTSRILKIVLDYDRLWAATKAIEPTLLELFKRRQDYDPFILEAFYQQLLPPSPQKGELESNSQTQSKKKYAVQLDNLKPGMVLGNDIFDQNGRLIIAKGTTITEVLNFRLINFLSNHPILETIWIESEDN